MSNHGSFVVTVDTEDCNVHEQRCKNRRSQKNEVMYTVFYLLVRTL
jgi:hypothetical protein